MSSLPLVRLQVSREFEKAIPMSSQLTSSPRTTMSFKIVLARASSTPFRPFKAFSSLESSCSAVTSAEEIETVIGGISCGRSGSDKSGAEFDRG